MMNPTMFDPIAKEAWYSDDENLQLLKTELETYLLLFSLLSVRTTAETVPNLYLWAAPTVLFPLPIWWTVSFECISENAVPADWCTSRGAVCGWYKLCKKRIPFCWCKTAVLRPLGKNRKLSVWHKQEICQTDSFLAYAGDNGYGLVENHHCTSLRNGTVMIFYTAWSLPYPWGVGLLHKKRACSGAAQPRTGERPVSCTVDWLWCGIWEWPWLLWTA